MSGYATGLMEYSDDPLSDTTPTYVDRSSYVVGDVSWSDGKARDLDEPQAGSITFRLRNNGGEWVPNHAGSLYPGSPFLLRRFRWSVDGTAEGVWYVVAWQVTYPAGTSYSEVQVTAVDGFELLSLDNLAFLDPPEAQSYPDVILADRPDGYWRLDEVAHGTVTDSGPNGLNLAHREGAFLGYTLGVAGVLVGDSNTATTTNTAAIRTESIEPSGPGDMTGLSEMTMEVWFKATDITPALDLVVFHLPYSTSAEPQGLLMLKTTGVLEGAARVEAAGANVTATSGVLSADTWYHAVLMIRGGMLRLYIDSVLVASSAFAGVIAGPPSSTPALGIEIGTGIGGTAFTFDEAAVYRYGLSDERVTAHYVAGTARGLPAQTAGDRVASVADSTLWDETGVQPGSHTVHEIMLRGQSKLDEVRAAVKAEMPDSHFFFDGDGNPAYLGWEYKAASPYNEPQGTFGHLAPGVIGVEGMEIVYDDEVFNEITVGHEAAAGEETQHTATDDESILEFYRRAHSETGLSLSDHLDAIEIADKLLEQFSEPKTRVASITLNGAQASARTHILERQIGDLIRVKGANGTPDVVTTILGRAKTLTAAGHLVCTWSTARGFNAEDGYWHLGIVGFSELGTSTVLA